MTTLLLIWVAANLWWVLIETDQHFRFRDALFWPVLALACLTALALVWFVNAAFDADVEIR